MTGDKTQPTCPLCALPGAKQEFTKKGAFYYRCASCGHAFAFPPPSPERSIEHYKSSYTESYLTQMTPWFRELARRRMSLIREHAPEIEGLSVLDVGCGWGFFLATASEHGCDAVGVDSSDACASYARDRFQIPVVCGEIPAALSEIVSHRQFDVITFWHVMEHLDHPGVVLRTAIRGLQEGGFLVVNSPNMDSAIFTLVGRWWSWIYAPGHVQYFSLRSLTQWLGRKGLELVLTETWTDAPNLYFLVEEAIAFRIADLLDRFGRRPGQRLSKKLEGLLYSSFHQMWIQNQFRHVYDATPWLDQYLKKRDRGHEFVIVARRRSADPGRE